MSWLSVKHCPGKVIVSMLCCINKISGFLFPAVKSEPVWPSADLKPSYDAIIIGAGLAGLTTACALAQEHGFTHIAVLEKEKINPSWGYELLSPLEARLETAHLYSLAAQHYHAFSHQQRKATHHHVRGSIKLLYSEADLYNATDYSEILRLSKVESWVITPKEISARLPALRVPAGVLGALWQPKSIAVERRCLLLSYASAACESGIDIVEHCAVSGIIVHDGHVTGVQTERGRIKARIVIATGGLQELLSPLEPVPAFKRQNVTEIVTQPVRGLPKPVMISARHSIQLLHAPEGQLIIKGLDTCDCTEHLAARALDLFPGLSRIGITSFHQESYAVPCDGLPVVGPASVPGLHLNSGWGLNVLPFAPGAAMAVAASIANRFPHPALTGVMLGRSAS
jgi:sarcosine oxidase subunit beta